MPLGSGASSLAWVLSAGLPRRWAVDRCQADGERDQRPRGAKADCHHRDEQPAEQRLPGGVPQPREVQERSEESEQDDHGRPHSTRVQELRRLPEIDLSGGCGRTVDCCIHGNAGTRCSRRRACGMDDLQNCDGVVARAVVLRQRCGSDPIGPFAGPAIPANAVVLARRSIHGGSASVSVASGKDDLGNYTDVPASFSSSRLRKFDSSTSPSGSTGAPMCAIHTPAGARIERPGRFPLGTTCGSTGVRATGARQHKGEPGAARGEAHADRTWLVGLHFRNANPDAAADLVVRLALGGRPFRKPRSAPAWRPRSWPSSSVRVSRQRPSRLVPPAAELAFGRLKTSPLRRPPMANAIAWSDALVAERRAASEGCRAPATHRQRHRAWPRGRFPATVRVALWPLDA